MINKARLVQLTQKLIQFNSENPPGNELALARFIEKKMISLGLKVKTYTFAPLEISRRDTPFLTGFAKNRPNVVAVLKGTSPKASQNAILLTPHIDTVPAGKGWSFNPYGGIVKNGRIYGRGATDDKGNLACAMEVMQSLVEDEVVLRHDVVLAATVDEETGSKKGIIPLIEKGILKPKAALILDSDEFSTIVAQKGLIHARLQIFGKKAHGAYNWYGVNAIELAAKVIADLKDHKFFYKKHHLLHKPTINIGTIRGGDKVNMVADFCEFSFDLRYLPGMNPQELLSAVKRLTKKHAKKFKLIVDDLQYPYEIDPQHTLVKTYADASRKLSCVSVLKGSEGATVISFFQKKRIPAVATGYGSQKTAHATNEYAQVEKLYKGAKVLEQFVKDFK